MAACTGCEGEARFIIFFRLSNFSPPVVADAVQIYEISDPEHPTYSQWMTIDEINAIVSPTPQRKQALRQLLSQHNVSVVADHGDYFRVRASVPVIESVFATQVWDFQHKKHQTKRLTRAKVSAWLWSAPLAADQRPAHSASRCPPGCTSTLRWCRA